MSGTVLRVFVTGTGTGVGKTLVAAALADGLARRGARVTYWKPVQAGTAEPDAPEVAMRAPGAMVAPPAFTFRKPASPDQAARAENAPQASVAALLAALDALGDGRASACDALGDERTSACDTLGDGRASAHDKLGNRRASARDVLGDKRASAHDEIWNERASARDEFENGRASARDALGDGRASAHDKLGNRRASVRDDRQVSAERRGDLQDSANEAPASDWLLVEGAGGLYVPLDDAAESWLDFLHVARMPALVVAASGLGTLNHTTLTVRALQDRGIPVLGVVLSGPAHAENEASLARLLPGVALARMEQIAEDARGPVSDGDDSWQVAPLGVAAQPRR